MKTRTTKQLLFSSLLFYLIFICFIQSTITQAAAAVSEPESIISFDNNQPQPPSSFNLSLIQNAASCPYTVVISTSCASPRYTRDQISLSFGDAYGNQIYAPRIDDPSTRTFEQCSTDTFQINGPCAYQICYVYLYRTGPDGWMPESVKIYGYNSRAATFPYNIFIPSDVWYGFNLCHSASLTCPQQNLRLLLLVWLMLAFVAGMIL